MSKSELTPRQWELYNFLKRHGAMWLYQYEIGRTLYGYKGDAASFHDTGARHALTDDIRAINDSNVIQKIILSTPRGIKLATKEEFEQYIKGEFAAVFRRLARVRKKAKKGLRDGQIKITFESKERDTVEAFLKVENLVTNNQEINVEIVP